jgi:MFS family permease
MNFGIRVNLGQFLQQLLQVLFVGMTIGMMRNGAAAAVCGLGMAMLYPNLSAAVADIAHPSWRASAIGIYRFWRDLGYGIGALGLGAAAALGGGLESAFWFVSIAMAFSGAVLHRWGEDTHPRLNPAH